MELYKNALYKEKSGQYAFYETHFNPVVSESKTENSFQNQINNFHKEALDLMKVKEEFDQHLNRGLTEEIETSFHMYTKNLFETFIENYLTWLSNFSLEEILNKYEYENLSNSYHLIGKLFLFYLHTFVYNDSLINQLNQERIRQMENFIEADIIQYRDPYYAYILKIELLNRKKLRVDGYVVYRIKPFLKKIEKLQNSIVGNSEWNQLSSLVINKQISQELSTEINILKEDEAYQRAIFEQGSEMILLENQSILSIFFLDYLGYCVYFNGVEYPNKNFIKFVEKLENYIIYNLNDQFNLTKRQEKIFEIVKNQVSKRIASYVERESETFLKMLKAFDQLQTLKKSHQLTLIEENENFDTLPMVFSSEEIQEKLELFLGTVFLLSKNLEKERIPIFNENLIDERNKALLLGMEYLNRYVYSVSHEYKLEEPAIVCLENYIDSCKDFEVKDASLCLAKSILYSRVNSRNVLKGPNRRKVLQSEKK